MSGCYDPGADVKGNYTADLSNALPPDFPVETRGVRDLHAALSAESRTRGRRRQREVGNPGTLCRKSNCNLRTLS
jgi:hypothetical protein